MTKKRTPPTSPNYILTPEEELASLVVARQKFDHMQALKRNLEEIPPNALTHILYGSGDRRPDELEYRAYKARNAAYDAIDVEASKARRNCALKAFGIDDSFSSMSPPADTPYNPQRAAADFNKCPKR